MREYIVRIFESVDEESKPCMVAEIKFDKPVLRNGAKHCRHFFIAYKTEEELQAILNEFSFEEVFVEPVEEKENEDAIEEVNE